MRMKCIIMHDHHGGAFSNRSVHRFGSPNSMIVVRRRGGTLPVVLRRPLRK
jgi:hypothetical protein